MNKWIVLLLAFCLAVSPLLAQGTGKDDKPQDAKSKKAIVAPTNLDQAKELFGQAWEAEKEQKYEDALACYSVLLDFFKNSKDHSQYTLDVLNNMGGIYASQGKIEDAIKTLGEGLQMSLFTKKYNRSAELYHKLGILYEHLDKFQANLAKETANIYPDKNKAAAARLALTDGTYTRLVQVGEDFVANRIELEGSSNPFEQRRDLYTKIVNLKVKGDFDPNELLFPDSVEFRLTLRKRGYYNVEDRPKPMLPNMDYLELNETMQAIPRKVEPQISEDFYRQGFVATDENNLTPLVDNKLVGKPVQITDKETFKPGKYRLSVQKAGYQPITEMLTIFPGDGPFILKRELQSKLRNIVYRIQTDFTPVGGEPIVNPDEISLSGQPIREGSKVKPAEYKLVIKKEGYEPIIKNIVIEPDERPYVISEFMKALPREVIFQLTGDYRPDEPLTPDDITFNGRFTKYGDSVRPDAYLVVIRKKGYEIASERIVVEPKSGPYIFKKMLISAPRRIQLNILASFPKNLPLTPESCTLNGKEATREESFKPGEYELFIKRSGYKPITKKVTIEPDELPFPIQETMYPKPVKINMEITQDVSPEDPNVKPRMTLTNERTQEILPVKDGDMIEPESYLFKAEMAGYDPELSKELFMPREEPYKITRRLSASLRSVVPKITADYPAGQQIVPDEITLNNKGIGKDFKIKPGTHDLVILKEGYLPVRKPVKILASEKEYILSEQLESQTRLVTFRFRDSYDRKELTPDEILLGKEKITTNAPQNLKPGQYPLEVRRLGYASLSETVLIPVGAGPMEVERFMVAIQRDVIIELVGDFIPDMKLIPDIATLNEMPTIFDKETKIGKIVVKPGKFNMLLQLAGYRPIAEELEITPDRKPFEIKRQLVSKPRQVNISVKSAFGENTRLVPDSFLIGTQAMKDRDSIKPGNYALGIKAKGHDTITEQILIEPAEEPYGIDRTMTPMPILVKYEVTNDFDEKPVIPDVITMNDKIIDQKATFPPGKYTVKIEKLGFNPKNFEILMTPSDQAYLIQSRLESMPREIELSVTGDFPPDRIDPEVAALGGKDVRDNTFKPGKFQLDIQQPGYFSLKEDLVIPPGEKSFLIEKVLKSKPRLIKEKITFDVKATEDTPPHKISVALAENPKAEKLIKEGESLKPGVYILRITREAYETVEERKYIWPAEEPYAIEKEMVAKEVMIRINVTYDVEPPKDLAECQVMFIDKKTGIPRFVSDGKRIKPGSYSLDVQRPGYSFGTRKDIEINPSEQAYQINEKLLAKPRPITFEMVNEGVLINAHQAVNVTTGKDITFQDKFRPGDEVDCLVKFRKFETVRARIRVVPGEGPFIANVPLKKLVKYEFSSRQNDQEIDRIKYPYVLYADSQLIESHLAESEKGPGGRWMYTVWVSPEAKNLVVYAGYTFAQIGFDKVAVSGIPRLDNISIPKLIEHLEQVSRNDNRGYRASLEVIEELLKSPARQSKIKAAHVNEITQLIQYIEGWKMTDTNDRVRMRIISERLDKLSHS